MARHIRSWENLVFRSNPWLRLRKIRILIRFPSSPKQLTKGIPTPSTQNLTVIIKIVKDIVDICIKRFNIRQGCRKLRNWTSIVCNFSKKWKYLFCTYFAHLRINRILFSSSYDSLNSKMVLFSFVILASYWQFYLVYS